MIQNDPVGFYFLGFAGFLLGGLLVMLIGSVTMELRKYGSCRTVWNLRFLASLIAVSIIFGLPFLYGAWIAWRESDHHFVLVLSSVTMFQMGIAMEAYAAVAFQGDG